jgi:hypothetical protein
MNRRLLGIYLNDHLAGSLTGLELAKRAASNNRNSEFGRTLDGIVIEIEEDRRSLEQLMGRLGIGRDRLKEGSGWLAEKVGRLKLNGALWRYSPLSRLEELEGLVLGVRGKLGLWHALQRLARVEPALRSFDLEGLAGRAQSQIEELERMRLEAAQLAFADGDRESAAERAPSQVAGPGPR